MTIGTCHSSASDVDSRSQLPTAESVHLEAPPFFNLSHLSLLTITLTLIVRDLPLVMQTLKLGYNQLS